MACEINNICVQLLNGECVYPDTIIERNAHDHVVRCENSVLVPHEPKYEIEYRKVGYHPKSNGLMGRYHDVVRDTDGNPVLEPVIEDWVAVTDTIELIDI